MMEKFSLKMYLVQKIYAERLLSKQKSTSLYENNLAS